MKLALPGLLTVVAVTAWVWIYLLSRRVRSLEAAAKEEKNSVQAILKMLDEAVQRLSGEVREAGERAGVLVAPVPPRSGLNLGKRSQALRLHRHGETPETIAANLDLPKAEVNLLLKIHQLVLKIS